MASTGLDMARPVSLDASGQLALISGEEVIYITQPGVDIYAGDVKSDRRRGDLIITSHRVVWVDKDRARPIGWSHAILQPTGVESEDPGLLHVTSAPKIILRLLGRAPAPALEPIVVAHVKLSFKEGGRDDVLTALRTSLSRRKWVPVAPQMPEASAPATKRARQDDFPLHVGLDAVKHREASKAAAAATLTATAFSDLKALEAHAGKLVALLSEYTAEAARAAAAAAGDAAAAPPAADDDIGVLMRDLGVIANPITRENAGKRFHEGVARQLASLLREQLSRVGGMMTLVDVFCVYNRARATELISPEDTLAAAGMLKPLRLGMALRTLPSGLRVIQLDDFSDDAVGARILAELKKGGGEYITSLHLAQQWRMPLSIASQQLLLAEAQGLLCRDDSVHGLRFYENRFVHAKPPRGAAGPSAA